MDLLVLVVMKETAREKKFTVQIHPLEKQPKTGQFQSGGHYTEVYDLYTLPFFTATVDAIQMFSLGCRPAVNITKKEDSSCIGCTNRLCLQQ